MKRTLGAALAAVVLLLSACGGGGANDPSAADAYAEPGKASVSGVRTAAPNGSTIDAALRGATGSVDVWVSLDQASMASAQAALAEATGVERVRALAAPGAAPQMVKAMSDHRASLRAQQATLGQSLASLGGTELARVHVAHNAVAVRIDASQLSQVAALSGVIAVRRVARYQLDLSETVPYVGGTLVQAGGHDGTGVRVAVLDSGIDYTHRNLGGAGTDAAYAAAYGAGPVDAKNKSRDGLFPTAKVVDGYDFVGEDWPNTPEAPDDDPIDFEGHGTHVADIIAGKSADGTHVGMAPGASLLAYKVCSAVATSCSGIALLQAMDRALDPNQDGDMSDAVDVINMSLGSPYGQIEDDLTLAAANAVKVGVVVVVSAGNSANRPYVVGSPSTAVGVISVAQTQTPSATAVPLLINAPAAIAGVYSNTQTLDFAPIGAGVTGDVVFFGRGCPGDAALVSPAGKIALIDRGACAVSLKVDAAAKAGATGVLIGLVAGGDAVAFSFGGGDTFVPALVIQQSLSVKIKAQLTAAQTVNVSLSTAAAIPLVGSMASTSSRGPAYSTQHIKPEIGAPGASLSAEAGTGGGETAFGGTSGAAPMVSGAAALMVQVNPNRSPEQIKAMLMNSAYTVVYTNPALIPGQLAPITRIGAGELRVDRAVALTSAAWNRETKSAALSFGAVEASRPLTITKKLRVENFSRDERLFTITPSFRYADDEASGAVKVLAASSLRVGARGREDLEVTLVIDPSKLPEWTLNGGSQGGNGAALDSPEFDGYLTLTAGSEKLSVPWHVLPRKAAKTTAGSVVRLRSSDGVSVTNTGTESGDYDVYSLTGTSPKLPRSALPNPGDNFAVVDLQSVGVRYFTEAVCGAPGGCLEFAIGTHGRRAHPAYPGGFEIDIDTNGDGVADYAVFNGEAGGFNVTGQTLVYVQKIVAPPATPPAASAFFYADADLNSGNMIMTVPMGAMGLQAGTTINFTAQAFDNYFSGLISDEITGMRFTPGSARYEAAGDPFGSAAPGVRTGVPIRATTVADTKTSESGLLFMFRRNDGLEAQTVKVR